MRPPSPGELRRLGEAFGVPLDDEAGTVRSMVADELDGVEAVADLASPAEGDAIAARSWNEPDDNPHNALVTECRVPPPADAGDLLAGVRVGVKDNVEVAGVPTTCASGVLDGYVPRTDATVVRRLLSAGATIVAKTNLDEFAGAGQGTTGIGGPITNPHDPGRTAGGSSGGSAAAVAAGTVDAALGTDTGGSVRIPACYCGVVGLKPTYGLVPAAGVVENTYTLDHVGPIAPSVGRAGAVLEAIAGPDDRYPPSARAAADGALGGYADAAGAPPDPGELRLGLVEAGFDDPVSDPAAERVRATVDALADAGASVERVAVEPFDAPAVKTVLQDVENAVHWRARGVAYRRGGAVEEYAGALGERVPDRAGELNPHLKGRLLAGAYLVEERQDLYARARAALGALRDAYAGALSGVDSLLTPTLPIVAPRVEDALPDVDYARNLRGANLAGVPAITVPAGSVEGLPVGIQLVGRRFEDDVLLAAAAAVEGVVER